ncbi:MAG: metallophosphoesterase, partial [Clostridia bacterium]|nr:metallophosphoesterase [Clostridia bacterium]
MKKKIAALLGFCMALCMTAGLAACASNNPPTSSVPSSGTESSSDSGSGGSSDSETDSGADDGSDGGSEGSSDTTPQEPEQPVFVEWADGDGVKFSPHNVTYELPAFEATPRAYEVWLRVPKDQSGAAGTVFGNNTDRTASGVLTLSVKENGVPAISINGNSVAFTEVDVRSDEFVHLAICLDKNNQTGKCYLNGELAQLIEEVSLGDVVTNDPFRVGGDFASGMPNLFQGEIKSVAFFKDIRISREVEADMDAVETTDENLLGAYDFNKIEAGDTVVSDLGTQANHLTIEKVWLDETDAVDAYDYSFAVVGDTQYIVDLDPEKLKDIYEWILENQVSQKIEYVMGLGDIVEHLYFETGVDLAAEWQYAREAIGKLDGKIGYSLVRGNHDGSRFFNETFGTDAYLSGVDGVYKSIENTYRTFVAGGYQYLVLTLDYQPTSDVLEWANEVVEAYPNHRVIVTTHSYIKSDASYTTSYDGGADTGGKVGQMI